MGHNDEMSCIKREYLRKKNTLNFSFNSGGGEPKNEIGNFEFLIPPASYPEHQKSQYGLFTLRSFYIINQTDTERVEYTDANGQKCDISGFYIQINGLGIAPLMSTGTNGRLRMATNQFPIMNKTAQAYLDGEGTNSYFTGICGGEYTGSSIACSNPMGTNISVKVLDMFDGSQIADNVELEAVITFDIELLDF
tara:strand:+ start:464 stop:1045 length:582 start_codon:yes stop_codon:yes gene_type:complete